MRTLIEERRSCRNCHFRTGFMWGSPECDRAGGEFCQIAVGYGHCGRDLKNWKRRRPFWLRLVLNLIGRG